VTGGAAAGPATADDTTDRDPSDRDLSDRDRFDRDPSDRGPSDRGPSDRGPSDRGPSDRDATGGHPSAGDGTDGDTGTAGGTTTGAETAGERERRQRRRRRLVVTGVAVAAALLVIALCAGGLAVLRSVSWFSDDDREEIRQGRLRRDASCLELEERLNRVAPPGSAANPASRAVAIRNENVALRPYLAELELRAADGGRSLDGWRQLLDARTAYAEALDKQAPSRTPAFFIAPRTTEGATVADQLARWSPAACAGPVRRLAVPDL
jgi:hypothetical protein